MVKNGGGVVQKWASVENGRVCGEEMGVGPKTVARGCRDGHGVENRSESGVEMGVVAENGGKGVQK